MTRYKIHLVTGKTIRFKGRYMRQLETNNWHYYEKYSGEIIHFRKEHIVYVSGGKICEVVENRKK